MKERVGRLDLHLARHRSLGASGASADPDQVAIRPRGHAFSFNYHLGQRDATALHETSTFVFIVH